MALVVNELVMNAIHHTTNPERPRVILRLLDLGPLARLQIINPDDRLPSGFDMDKDAGLGLKIVQILVRNELEGQFRLYNDARLGVVAEITFQKKRI